MKLALGVGALAGVAGLAQWFRFPPDTEPEGAYLRIVRGIGAGEPVACFAYLEEEAQHACFTIHDYAVLARDRVRAAYPPEAQEEALHGYVALAERDGPEVWVLLAQERGWIRRLRRDLSGIAEVARDGDRATITTARGTRYSFRRRPNGIWGLTLFTAELIAEAERLARDWETIQQAAADYVAAEGD